MDFGGSRKVASQNTKGLGLRSKNHYFKITQVKACIHLYGNVSVNA